VSVFEEAQPQSADNTATRNGVVLDLVNAEDRNRCFDVNWVSDAPYENETIFIGGLNCHQIVSVRDLQPSAPQERQSSSSETKSSNKNLHNYERYLLALGLLSDVVQGRKKENNTTTNENMNMSYVTESLKRLVQYRLKSQAHATHKKLNGELLMLLQKQSYIHAMFAAFCESLTNWITVDFNFLEIGNTSNNDNNDSNNNSNSNSNSDNNNNANVCDINTTSNEFFNYICIDMANEQIRFDMILNLFCNISKIVIKLDAGESNDNRPSRSGHAHHLSYVLNDNMIECLQMVNNNRHKYCNFECIEFQNVSPHVFDSPLFAKQAAAGKKCGWTFNQQYKYDNISRILLIRPTI
jgi:hypothetical protein